MRNLFLKTLYDKRIFIIGWSVGLAFISYLMTIFYPAFHDTSGIEELAKSLPPAVQGLVGNFDDFKHLATYLGSELYNIRMPIFASIVSILLAVSLTVAEEDKGQLRTLAAMPLSRTHILFSKWFAIVVICTIVSLATIVGVNVGALQIGESFDQVALLRLVGLLILVVVALATLIMSIGFATGKRGITTGIGILVAVGSFILTTFAVSVDWLKDYEKVSIFHYYPASTIARGTVEWSNVIVYVAVIVVSLVVAIIFFRRRDLN
jgi:ABC-2 type transport system permease protein